MKSFKGHSYISLAVFGFVISCSPITPSSSKFASSSADSEKSTGGLLKETSSVSRINNYKVISPIVVSETEYLKKMKPLVSAKDTQLVYLDKEQESSLFREGKFDLSLSQKKSEVDGDSIQIKFIIDDNLAKNEPFAKEEILMSIELKSETEEYNSSAEKSLKLAFQLVSPSLDSKDPVIGARADRLLHSIEKVVIQYKLK